MDANRFFSVPYDNRNDVTIRRMRKTLDDFAAYGRWIALLGMLYDSNGVLDVSDDVTREIVAEELSLTNMEEFETFFRALSNLGLIEPKLYAQGHIVNDGVCEQLAYRRTKSEAGKRGGRSKKGNSNS
jgi:hypothetical protein